VTVGRLVTHRWSLDEGQDPNAFRALMEPLGEWDPAVEHARRASADGEPARFRYTPRDVP